jgi:2-oxoglutarate dehydrogenase E1 component
MGIKMNEQSSNEFFHGSSFMQGQNAEYLESLQQNFQQNPNSVDSAWQAFFQSIETDLADPDNSSKKT